MRRLIILTVLIVSLFSCKEVYEAPPKSLVQITLLNSETEKPITSKISVWGLGLEKLWLYDTSLNTFMLQLSMEETSKFIITFDNYVDTLTINAKIKPRYESIETGFYNDFKIKSIKHSKYRIKYFIVTDSLITKEWHENIKLYISPLPTGGQ